MKKIVIAACLLLGANLLADCYQRDILQEFDPARYKVIWIRDNGDYIMIDKKTTKVNKKKKIIEASLYFIRSDKEKRERRSLGVRDDPNFAYTKVHELIDYGESMSRQTVTHSTVYCYGSEERDDTAEDRTKKYVIAGTVDEQLTKKIMDALGLQ